MRPTAWLVAVGCFSVCVTDLSEAKDGRTYYTPERVAIARTNIEKYDWARAVRERIIETGDPWRYYIDQNNETRFIAPRHVLDKPDDFVWLLMPSTAIPRVIIPNTRRATCPTCKDKVRALHAFCPWTIDPFNHPYKILCPLCKKRYPSNDYINGDMTSGEFPDDGTGLTYEDGKYFPLSDYAHMVYGSVVVKLLRTLGEAYQLSGDEKYAHKGAVLLARVATQYPNYGWDAPRTESRFDRTFLGPWNNIHPDYRGEHGGMITDAIWENFTTYHIILAYDAFYDYLGSPKLLAFLRTKGMTVRTGEDLREYIEQYILRPVMRALLRGEIGGNPGFRQRLAMAAALVYDDYDGESPNSTDMVDFAWFTPGHSSSWFQNSVDSSGGGHESVSYNALRKEFIAPERLMDAIRKAQPGRFPLSRYSRIFGVEKGTRYFDFFINVLYDGTLIPIGDCGGIDPPRRLSEAARRKFTHLQSGNVFAVSEWGHPRHARAATDAITGRRTPGDLFETYPGEKMEQLLNVPTSKITRTSRLLDGFGVGIFESGEYPDTRAAFLNYSDVRNHRQNDSLTIGISVNGLELLKDIGYPQSWRFVKQWDGSMRSHNTVSVDETERGKYALGIRANSRYFIAENGIHAVAASHEPYRENFRKGAKPVEMYERSLLMVELDTDRCYFIDLFLVNGGEQHDQSWHAMLVDPELPQLDWKVQDKGTLAGEDVPEFGPHTDRWGREFKDGSFSSFLTNIRRADFAGRQAVTWHSGLPEGDAIRVHALPVHGGLEAIVGEGRNPVWQKRKLPFLILRRQVQAGAPTVFATVLEPFRREPILERAAISGDGPYTITLERKDGKTDTCTFKVPLAATYRRDPRLLGFRLQIAQTPDHAARVFRAGDCGDEQSPGYVHATIDSTDYPARRISFNVKVNERDDFRPGRAIRIYNEWQSSLWRIEKVELVGTLVTLTLDNYALAGHGPVRTYYDDAMKLEARFIRATTGFTDGKIRSCNFVQDEYIGMVVGEEPDAFRVRAVGPLGSLALMEKPGRQELARIFRQDEIVSIYAYGRGDKVELMRVSY